VIETWVKGIDVGGVDKFEDYDESMMEEETRQDGVDENDK
jgi:hypothetical protein